MIKIRAFRQCAEPFDGNYLSKKETIIDKDGLKTIDPVEVSKSIDPDLFNVRSYIENGQDINRMVLFPTTPIDGITVIEDALNAIDVERAFEHNVNVEQSKELNDEN